MADRYIYTRASSPGQGVSSGFVGRSAGVVGAVQSGIREMVGCVHDTRNLSGEYIDVWEKRSLPDRPDKLVFQRSVRRGSEKGSASMVHGFVLDRQDALVTHPECWNGFPFWPDGKNSDVPDLTLTDEVALTPKPLAPLSVVLGKFLLTPERFSHAVRCCFDAVNRGTTVYLAADYKQVTPEESLELILWLCRFLPYALRRSVDYTTCCDSGRCGAFTIAILPAELVLERGEQLLPRADKGIYLGAGTLFAKGRTEHGHNTHSGDFAFDRGLYGRWLDRTIADICASTPQQAEAKLARVEALYARFDTMIASLPESSRCRPTYYDSLLWLQLRNRERDNDRIQTETDLTCFENLLSFGGWPEILQTADDMLDVLKELYSAPASRRLIVLTGKLVLLGGSQNGGSRAAELLSAFLSKDMEGALVGESSTVSARYLHLLNEIGLEGPDAAELLERCFFPEEFPETAESGFWTAVGCDRTAAGGIRRCADWISGYVNVCNVGEDLLTCGDTILRELDGFTAERLSRALDMLLEAQTQRCRYSLIDIQPRQLTDCIRNISLSRESVHPDYQAAAEGYYTRLLGLLSESYLRCRKGTCSLRSVIQLRDTFRQEGSIVNNESILKELTINVCTDLATCEWEELKKRLDLDGREILSLLWEVLDLLLSLGAPHLLNDELAGQVCRYLLHRLPDYVDDAWISSEMMERYELSLSGYYLEMRTLQEFFSEEPQDLEHLQACIRLTHLKTEPMKDVMRFLLRTFARGGMHNLDLTAVQGIYIAGRDRAKYSQAEIFRIMAKVRGGQEFVNLLYCWPESDPVPDQTIRRLKQSKEHSRGGAYSWLKTDQSLFAALTELSHDRDFLLEHHNADSRFLPDLMDAVYRLAPVGSEFRRDSIPILRALIELAEEVGDLKLKMLCSSRKRKLLAE